MAMCYIQLVILQTADGKLGVQDDGGGEWTPGQRLRQTPLRKKAPV
jgi:hypothetical protein